MRADTPIFDFTPGTTPLLISVPHAGTWIPDELAEAFTARARTLPDTDWLVDELYGFAGDLGVGVISANCSRYLVDLNRPPDDTSLYKSKTTGLYPQVDFTGAALYHDGRNPDETERAERLNRYWNPYHYQVRAELNRLRAVHGHAIVLDAHSIAAEVPMLFPGRLPDFNLGSNDGTSAQPDLIERAWTCLRAQQGYSSVLDGRFKGGFITRHYGAPETSIHALQLELSQETYLATGTEIRIDAGKYRLLKPVLQQLVETFALWKPVT